METQIFKCGGKFFVPNIVQAFFVELSDNIKSHKTVFVISAMAGITRLLRLIFIIKTEIKIDEELKTLMISLCMNEFQRYHSEFIFKLFSDSDRGAVIDGFESLFNKLEDTINSYKSEDNKDLLYSSLLQYGELASSQILSKYMNTIGIKNKWFDARDYVVTDDNYREAEILNIKNDFQEFFKEENILITQGFIGRDVKGENTVVGFDGSDYSAAEFANSLVGSGEKVSLTYWKDVEGVYEENPVKNPEAKLINKMTRKEYLHNTVKNNSFVVRPDSISSLSENIEVSIRSFINFENQGTKIQ
jgi:aspartate kinase